MRIENIAIDRIKEFVNPLRTEDHDNTDLEESIKKHGVLSPVTVREVEGGFQLLNGRLRVLAARVAGLTEIPAQVLTLSEAQAVEVITLASANRIKTNPNDYGNQLERLIQQGYSFEQLAERLSMSVEKVKRLHDKRDK